METSAKTGQNARNVLIEAAKMLYNDFVKFDENKNNDTAKNNGKNKGTELISKNIKKEKGKCC